jgi:enoyl-[acyl-carrier protein] reductase I
VAFLLSDWSKGISGEIVHVDGGFHAMGADVRPRDGELGAAVAAAEEEPAPASDS